jgi:predicted double-glycine peptidase
MLKILFYLFVLPSGFAHAHTSCEFDLIEVPMVAQVGDHSCGVACTISMLQFFTGKTYDEPELMRVLGTNESGTKTSAIATFFNNSGFPAEIRSNLTLPDLHKSIRNGQAVMLSIYSANGTNHFVLLRGISATEVILMDPWLARVEKWRTERLSVFLESWFNLHGKRKYERLSLVVSARLLALPPPDTIAAPERN